MIAVLGNGWFGAVTHSWNFRHIYQTDFQSIFNGFPRIFEVPFDIFCWNGGKTTYYYKYSYACAGFQAKFVSGSLGKITSIKQKLNTAIYIFIFLFHSSFVPYSYRYDNLGHQIFLISNLFLAVCLYLGTLINKRYVITAMHCVKSGNSVASSVTVS